MLPRQRFKRLKRRIQNVKILNAVALAKIDHILAQLLDHQREAQNAVLRVDAFQHLRDISSILHKRNVLVGNFDPRKLIGRGTRHILRRFTDRIR